MRWLILACVILAAQPLRAAEPDAHALQAASTALESYVAKPDDSYEWHVRARYHERGAELVELVLTSQTWRGVPWKHQLVLIKPARVDHLDSAVLIVGGGRWRDSYDEGPPPEELQDGADTFIAIARRLHTVVAVLGQVPFQPLFDRREDELIAYTFDQYLKSGDPEWPLLLPMVKTAVRAMDASSAAAAAEWQTPLSTYTVLGGSKRGWTTWLTAAVDPRVTALVPAVIDALNMAQHFPHQTATWGAPSEKIRPYTDLDLPRVLGSDDGAALRRIVDPWEYRASITQPKLVVLATNDAFFPVDSANLYWDSLVGPKYLLYLPNDQHSIRDYRRLIPTLQALHDSVHGGKRLPDVAWEYRWADGNVTLCVRSSPAPDRVVLWRSESADRDFRDAVWARAAEEKRGATRVFDVPRPASGYSGVFAEAVYGRGLLPYSLSTNLALLTPAGTADLDPRPSGTPGVCAAAAPR
ncbi:MAG TPA: PhoPQ-activated protein PqaA family protein [Gammaproteobacteria bacterium]|nr:PhoPQ-activated protein PqaA family protein [Gammaproteobacteria bacterium]